MEGDLIALFEFVLQEQGVAVAQEKHYKLVTPNELALDELRSYANVGG